MSGFCIFEGYWLLYDVMVVVWFWVVGMILLGKINMDEFVMGFFMEYFVYGLICNLWDFDCIFGGFGGGLVVVVVVFEVLFVFGFDIGGLIC